MYKTKKNKQSKKYKRTANKNTINKALTLPRYPFKLSIVQDHYTSGSGVLSQNVHCCDPSACSDWTQMSGLFDLFRMKKVVITAFPSFSQNDIATTVQYPPLFIVYDAESTSGPVTVDTSVQYGNCKTVSILKKWKYSVRPINAPDNSVNNAGMQTFQKYGKTWLDVANVLNYQKGIISWYGTGFPNNTPTFKLKVDYYAEFCNRK